MPGLNVFLSLLKKQIVKMPGLNVFLSLLKKQIVKRKKQIRPAIREDKE